MNEVGGFAKIIKKYGVATTLVSTLLFVLVLKLDWITEQLSIDNNYEITTSDTLYISQAIVWQNTDSKIRDIRTFATKDYGEYSETVLLDILNRNRDIYVMFLNKDIFCAKNIGTLYYSIFPHDEFNEKVLSIILTDYDNTLTKEQKRVETELRLTLVEAITRSYQSAAIKKLELILNGISSCDT